MIPAPHIPDTITGAELAALIEREAAARNIRPAVLVDGLSSQPYRWLTEVRSASRLRPHTILRVRALFSGGPIPPGQPNGVTAPRRRPDHFVARQPETAPAPVNRDPCQFCATRADLGCRHTRRAGAA